MSSPLLKAPANLPTWTRGKRSLQEDLFLPNLHLRASAKWPIPKLRPHHAHAMAKGQARDGLCWTPAVRKPPGKRTFIKWFIITDFTAPEMRGSRSWMLAASGLGELPCTQHHPHRGPQISIFSPFSHGCLSHGDGKRRTIPSSLSISHH